MSADLESLLSDLPWSSERLTDTSEGPRSVRSAPATKEIVDLWDHERGWMKKAGYSVGEFPRRSGHFQISKWSQVEQPKECS